jgi:hypothetical protein
MKKLLAILLCLFAGAWVSVQTAHAQFMEEPGQFAAPPYPYITSPLITNLPEGFITIRVGLETYYYSNGDFFQKIMREQKYVLVPPPIGAVVFDLPTGYELMLVDDLSIYVFKGVYYKRVLEGYKVIFPPA